MDYLACERRHISGCHFTSLKWSNSRKYVCVRRLWIIQQDFNFSLASSAWGEVTTQITTPSSTAQGYECCDGGLYFCGVLYWLSQCDKCLGMWGSSLGCGGFASDGAVNLRVSWLQHQKTKSDRKIAACKLAHVIEPTNKQKLKVGHPRSMFLVNFVKD